MEDDDLAKQPSDLLAQVMREDLDAMGIEALTERINHLKTEIIRSEAAIKARDASRAAAEAFFKS